MSEILPTQASLDALFAAVTQVRIVAAGMSKGRAHTGQVVALVEDDESLEGLRAALRIEENPAVPFICICPGGPTLELVAGNAIAATLGLQHGKAIRSSEWDFDATLVDGSALNAWLAAHGIPPERLELMFKGRFDLPPVAPPVPESAEALAAQAKQLLADGDYHSALRVADRALGVDPLMHTALAWRAMAHMALHFFEAAEADAIESISSCDTFYPPYMTRGTIRMGRNDLGGAVEDFSAVVRLIVAGGPPSDPRDLRALVEAYVQRCTAYLVLNLLDEASEDANRAVRLDPGYADAHFVFGRILYARQQYAEALQAFTQAAELNPNRGPIRLERGRAFLMVGNPEAAEWEFKHAIRASPSPTAYRLRAQALAQQRRFEEALADCDEAIRLNPEEPWGFTMRSNLNEYLGRFAELRRDLARILTFWPNDPTTIRALAWLLATCPDASVRDGARALGLAQRAVMLHEDPHSLDCLAAAHAECGDFPEACMRAEEALALGPADVPALQARLELYQTAQPYRAPAPVTRTGSAPQDPRTPSRPGNLETT